MHPNWCSEVTHTHMHTVRWSMPDTYVQHPRHRQLKPPGASHRPFFSTPLLLSSKMSAPASTRSHPPSQTAFHIHLYSARTQARKHARKHTQARTHTRTHTRTRTCIHLHTHTPARTLTHSLQANTHTHTHTHTLQGGRGAALCVSERAHDS